MKFILPLICGVLTTSLFAQTSASTGGQTGTSSGSGQSQPTSGNATDSEVPTLFWQATLPGGVYLVALKSITSCSRHTYLLDGGLIVDEVTVDTNGQSLARFYYIAPLSDAMNSSTATGIVARGKQLLDMAGQRTGADIHNMVQKTYPTTTHARCVEYRLVDDRDLLSLYSSVTSAWQTGHGHKFTVKSSSQTDVTPP